VVLSDGEHWRCTNLDLLERSTKQARINVRFWPIVDRWPKVGNRPRLCENASA
jgi:hypothetical protein